MTSRVARLEVVTEGYRRRAFSLHLDQVGWIGQRFGAQSPQVQEGDLTIQDSRIVAPQLDADG